MRTLKGVSHTLPLLTALTLCAALALVFFYAPLEADQGFLQKIFYVHVPLAIVSLCGFVAGGLLAIGHLRTGESKWDLRSYVAIHMALIFGVGGLVVLLALADVARAVIGTLVSALAVQTRARDLIGPIIGQPLLIPALIATARGLGPLLLAHGPGFPQGHWLALLALYDLVFALLAYAVFDFLLED